MYKKCGDMDVFLSRADDFDKFGVSPDSFDHGAFLHEELSKALNPVIMKITLEHFCIGEHDFSPSFFCVFDKHSFIVLPIILKKVKIGKIKSALKLQGVIVVYFSESMELILAPVSLIRKFPAFIVKFPPSVHLVVPPLSLIITSILIEEFSMPISLCIQFVPFITRTSLILFNHVLMIAQIDVMLCVPHSWFRVLRVLISHLHNCAVVFVLVGSSYWCGLSVVNVFVVVGFIDFVGRKLHLLVNVVRASMHKCLWLLLLWKLFLILCQSRLL